MTGCWYWAGNWIWENTGCGFTMAPSKTHAWHHLIWPLYQHSLVNTGIIGQGHQIISVLPVPIWCYFGIVCVPAPTGVHQHYWVNSIIQFFIKILSNASLQLEQQKLKGRSGMHLLICLWREWNVIYPASPGSENWLYFLNIKSVPRKFFSSEQ